MTADVVRSLSAGQAEIAVTVALFSQIQGRPLAENQAFQEGIAGQAVAAVNAVAARFADGIEVVHRRPTVAVDVDTHLTGTYSDKLLEQAVRCFFDLTPAGMIHTLQLNQPIFADACNYGHFTRANLPWEQTGQAGKFAELCAQLDHGDGGG